MREQKRISDFAEATSCLLGLALACAIVAGAQERPARPQVLSNAVTNQPIAFDTSVPLRDLPVKAVPSAGNQPIDPPLLPKLGRMQAAAPQGASVGIAASQSLSGPLIDVTVGLSFDGVGENQTNNCPNVAGFAVAPPDTNGAVGDTQFVQWVNVCYAVFDKATGALIAGPFPGNHFWAGFNPLCKTPNDGDIIIQWDKANHVWVASQNFFGPRTFFSRRGTGPYGTCVAVSQTADATGSYNRYMFRQPGLPDYPKWGLTPDVYYQTQNDFGPAGKSFVGVNVCAYDGAAMRAGTAAKQICILDDSNGTLFDDSMLPADNDYASSPGDAPSQEVLLGSIDNFFPGDTHVYEYVFTVSFEGKGSATLAGVNGSMPISVPGFNLALCAPAGFLTSACVPQPGVTDLMDTLGDRLMYRLAHFDDGAVHHFLVTHSVNNSTAIAARWYEFQAPDTSPAALVLSQSGNSPDDGKYRWMGSVARDKHGNIALGYSRSSAAAGDYPSVYLSGQTAGEAAGTTDGETLLFAGSGSQSDTGGRWGDYSGMALDGADSCTFWYTNEYYPATASFAWNTRIAGQIRFPSCR